MKTLSSIVLALLLTGCASNKIRIEYSYHNDKPTIAVEFGDSVSPGDYVTRRACPTWDKSHE